MPRNIMYLTQAGQTPEDIAIQFYGDVGGVVHLEFDNPGLDLTQAFLAGQLLEIKSEPIDHDTVEYFHRTGIRLNTTQMARRPSLQYELQTPLG